MRLTRRRFVAAAGAAAAGAAGLAPGSARAQKAAIKVGGLFDLTGVTSEVGKPFAQGVIDHVKVLNERGGVNGRPIELVPVDYGYKVPQAVAAYKKFRDEGVILINGWGTGDTEALRKSVNEDRIPYISASFSGHLTDPKQTPYNFFVGASYSDQLRIFLKYVKEVTKPSGGRPVRVAFVYADNAYGRAPIEAGRKYAKEIGVELVDEQLVPSSFQDSTSQLLSMKQKDPDWAYVNTTTTWVAQILKDAYKLQLRTKFGSNPYGYGEKLPELAKEAAEGVVGMLPNVLYGADVPGMKAILEYHKRNRPSVAPDNLYVRGWVYVTVWGEALRRTGTDLTPEGVKNALESFRDFDTGGLTPPLTYTAQDHRPTTRSYIYVVKNGKVVKDREGEVPRKPEWLGL
jgi:branched-chain amino acid transport system substrate-binding protein